MLNVLLNQEKKYEKMLFIKEKCMVISYRKICNQNLYDGKMSRTVKAINGRYLDSWTRTFYDYLMVQELDYKLLFQNNEIFLASTTNPSIEGTSWELRDNPAHGI